MNMKTESLMRRTAVKSRAGCFLLSFFLFLSACATTPRVRVYNDFVIVRTTPSDTLSSLAVQYLHDAEKAWEIAEFNGVTSLTPDCEVVIPLVPFRRGGLRPDGYQTVPVLAYHGVSKNNAGERVVAEKAFRSQMRYLRENGYHVIGLDQLMDFLDFSGQIPKRSVVITFDEDLRSVYEIAFPILKEYGFPAVLFVRTDRVGNTGSLTWKQIAEMAENGFEIGSETTTGRDLTKLKSGDSFRRYFSVMRGEISQSKKIIENRLKRPCRYLAYPGGKANALVIAVLKKTGYRAAFTLKRGRNPVFVNPYLIHRSVIHGGYDMKKFKAKLSVFCRTELR